MKQLAFGTIGGIVLVLWFFVGWYPIAEAMYRHHLLPHASAQEVQDALHEARKGIRYECEDGTDGWDYICYSTLVRNGGEVVRAKLGGIGNPVSDVPALIALPLDAPTPNRDEYFKAMSEGRLQTLYPGSEPRATPPPAPAVRLPQ